MNIMFQLVKNMTKRIRDKNGNTMFEIDEDGRPVKRMKDGTIKVLRKT